MAEYINKADIIKLINDCMFDLGDSDDLTRMLTKVDEMPTVEIIHCKDCKHWREGDAYSYCHKLFNCGVLDVYDYMRVEDDFCSIAEKCEE